MSCCLPAGLVLSLLCVASIASAQAGKRLPVIEYADPTSGPPGTRVSVVGRRFEGDVGVSLGGVAADLAQVLPNRVTFVVPEGGVSGRLVVRAGSGEAIGPTFHVTAPVPAPVMVSIAPRMGPAGTEVVIRGKHFSPEPSGNAVWLGDAPAVILSSSPLELRVVVPAAAAGDRFVVRVGQGRAVTAAETFVVIPRAEEPAVHVMSAASLPAHTAAVTSALRVDAFTPRSGPVGTLVRVTGDGFDPQRGRTTLTLGGRPAELSSATATALAFHVPGGGASGLLEIRVPSGASVGSVDPFVITRPPEVHGVVPGQAPVGTDIVIAGLGFGDDVSLVRVTLGDVPLAVRSVRDDRVVVRIVTGARSGDLRVHVPLQGTSAWRETFVVLR